MRRILLAAVLLGCGGQAAGPPPPTPAAPSASAKKAPDFTLVDTDGKPVALHDLLKNGPVILAFFPKAFTAG